MKSAKHIIFGCTANFVKFQIVLFFYLFIYLFQQFGDKSIRFSNLLNKTIIEIFNVPYGNIHSLKTFQVNPFNIESNINWAAPSEFVTYRLCEQRRFRRACASAQSRQNLRCSLIQAVS